MITKLEQDISGVLEKHGIYLKKISTIKSNTELDMELNCVHRGMELTTGCTHNWTTYRLVVGGTISICSKCNSYRV